MATKTEICNMALSHLAVGKEISDIDTETSPEAKVCRVFFDTARDATLRDFAWSFASAREDLALIETLTDSDSDSEWVYSYQYPSGALKIRRIMSGTRNDSRQTRIPYEIMNGTSGRLIYTDQEDARIEYTTKITDETLFPADFIIALSYRLAHYIAPRLTNGDPFKLGEFVMQKYDIEVSRAQASDRNEIQKEELPKSELERARE